MKKHFRVVSEDGKFGELDIRAGKDGKPTPGGHAELDRLFKEGWSIYHSEFPGKRCLYKLRLELQEEAPKPKRPRRTTATAPKLQPRQLNSHKQPARKWAGPSPLDVGP